MKRLVIHPGLGKVGSTSIQSTILRNKGSLRTMGWQGIALPQELPEQSSLLMDCYCEHLLPEESYLSRTRNIKQVLVEADRKKIVSSISKCLAESRNDNIFLSSEYFLDLHPDRRINRLRALRELIEPIRDSHRVEFLVYFRRQDALVESLYQQFFKPEFSDSFDRFLDAFELFNTNQDRIFLTLDYQEFINDIRAEFPTASIHPSMLELLTDRGEGLCEHAFSFLDLDLKRIEFAQESKNRGCTGEAIFLINHWNDQGIDVSPDVAKYVRETGLNFRESGYRLFSLEQRQMICDAYFESNARLFRPEADSHHVFRTTGPIVPTARENVESCLSQLAYEKVSKSLGYKSFKLKARIEKQIDGLHSVFKRNR